MSRSYLEEVTREGQTVNPLFAFLGVCVGEIGQGRAVLTLVVRESFIQGAGVAAGGILATLLDEAMAHAVLSALPPGRRCATVELSTRYLRPVRAGDALAAEARVVKNGRTIVFVEAEIRNQDGQPVARADATFAAV